MVYISIAFQVIMSVTFVTCGVLLWRRREETGDNARVLLAFLCWISAFVTFMFVFRTLNGTTLVDMQYLSPEHIFVPMIFQMGYFLYPLELLKARENKGLVYFYLFAPLMLLSLIGTCAGIDYVELTSYDSIWDNILSPDVLFRVLSLAATLLYGFALYLIPYDDRVSSVNRVFILNYATGYLLMGVLFFLEQLSHSPVFLFLHQLVWSLFFVIVTRYELKARLFKVVKTENVHVSQQEEKTRIDRVWESVMQVLEEDQEWRNPDMTLSMLASKVFSNRTYVGEAFKRNAGIGFSEYMSKRRIGYVTEQLKLNPDADMQNLFFYVGYRSYSTAWDNFRRVTGMTVSEFITSLKTSRL